MKNLKYIPVISLTIFLGFCFVVTARGTQGNSGNQDSSQGEPNVIAPAGNQERAQAATQTQNKGEEQQIMAKTSIEYKAQNENDLKEAIQAKNSELAGQASEEKNNESFKNQNTIRVAVHALLVSEGLTWSIGPKISEIAKEFNNSIQVTTQAEEKIRTRSTVSKIFMGGNKEAAGKLEQETIRNQNRIEELNQLMNQCTECSTETKNILQEQIQLLEQEQERLGNLAENEMGKKGILGFLFGWMTD